MTVAAAILELRSLVKDATDSNFILEETPHLPGGGKPDGSGLKFRLQRQYIVTGSVYLTTGSTFRTQTGFTVDLTNGILTFSVAPVAGVTPFIVDYNFYWFPDSYYTEFLLNAAKALGFADATTVPATLFPAMLEYGKYYFYMARASEYAHKYASSANGSSQQVESVTGNFRALAKMAKTDADKMRDDYYLNQGRNLSPASQLVTYKIDPFTPKR